MSCTILVHRLRWIVVTCTLATLATAGCNGKRWLQRKHYMLGVTMRHDIWVGLRKVSQQLDQVVKYESGELDEPTTIALFQSLIESGLAWSLPGNYGRTATELITLGVCHPVQRSLHQQVVMG
jgi:hypothetical protein